MKTAIIGSGGIAQIHGPQILRQPDAKLVAIVDKDASRAAALASEVKAEHFYTDVEIMLKEQRPDIVHILTPPEYHADLSIMVMNKGCHVLVEKPMALTVNDARRMIDTAVKNNVKLCVDHSMLFEEVIQAALKMVSEGTIGKVISVESHFSYNPMRNPAWVEEGAQYSYWAYHLNGGPIQDLFPHPASAIMEFLPEIKEVHSVGQSLGALKGGWQDELRVIVKSNSLIGYISITLNERPDAIILTIKGKKGVIQANLFNGILTYQKQSGLPRAVSRGFSGFNAAYQNFKQSSGNIINFARGRVDKSGGIGPLITKFYNSIQHGGEIPVSNDKGLNVVDLMNRIWPVPSVNTPKVFLKPQAAGQKNREQVALVTGSTGFLGTHLINRLMSENIRVRALVRPNSIRAGKLKNLDVDVIEADLSNSEAIYEAAKGVKTIFHAGSAMNNNWDDHYNSTIKGTENLIKTALDNDVERFVYISSIVVYELNTVSKKKIITEDSPYQKNPRAMGPYVYSKIEAERLLLDSYKDKGLAVSIIRPGMIIGPFGKIFFPHFGYRYQDRLFVIIGDGRHVLPFTYVENTVDGIFKASVEPKAIGQIYNIMDDGEIGTRKYIERFIEVTGVQARIINIPYMVPYLATTAYEMAAAFDLLKKGATSRAQLKWKQRPVLYDNSKAKNELGWGPNIPIDEGMRRTFEWYKNTFLSK